MTRIVAGDGELLAAEPGGSLVPAPTRADRLQAQQRQGWLGRLSA